MTEYQLRQLGNRRGCCHAFSSAPVLGAGHRLTMNSTNPPPPLPPGPDTTVSGTAPCDRAGELPPGDSFSRLVSIAAVGILPVQRKMCRLGSGGHGVGVDSWMPVGRA